MTAIAIAVLVGGAMMSAISMATSSRAGHAETEDIFMLIVGATAFAWAAATLLGA